MEHKMRRISKENRRGPSGPETAPKGSLPGELERATIVTTIRRFGWIATKMHEVIMGRLVRQQEHELAEQFNDVFKPLADLLVHFNLDDTLEGEGDSSSDGGGNDGV